MESDADSTPEYLLTPLIPQKSVVPCFLVLPVLMNDIAHRILIASIRNLGTCPCPRYHIPLNQVHNLENQVTCYGVTAGLGLTIAHAVNSARRLIYQQNYQVNSAAVERILRPNSHVPSALKHIIDSLQDAC